MGKTHSPKSVKGEPREGKEEGRGENKGVLLTISSLFVILLFTSILMVFPLIKYFPGNKEIDPNIILVSYNSNGELILEDSVKFDENWNDLRDETEMEDDILFSETKEGQELKSKGESNTGEGEPKDVMLDISSSSSNNNHGSSSSGS